MNKVKRAGVHTIPLIFLMFTGCIWHHQFPKSWPSVQKENLELFGQFKNHFLQKTKGFPGPQDLSDLLSLDKECHSSSTVELSIDSAQSKLEAVAYGNNGRVCRKSINVKTHNRSELRLPTHSEFFSDGGAIGWGTRSVALIPMQNGDVAVRITDKWFGLAFIIPMGSNTSEWGWFQREPKGEN